MPTMKYRVLGHSGVQVSELCLGTMMFGGPADEAQSRRIVDHALESGVNFIDTADVYTDSQSEEVIAARSKTPASAGCWPPRSPTRPVTDATSAA